jgi:hypothetical protein
VKPYLPPEPEPEPEPEFDCDCDRDDERDDLIWFDPNEAEFIRGVLEWYREKLRDQDLSLASLTSLGMVKVLIEERLVG